MNRDEARNILGEGATEEQITNLLNNYHVQESAKTKALEEQVNNLSQQISKYSDYDSLKSQLDEINKAKMTEEEKIAELKKQTEENYKISKMAVSRAKAKEILAGENLTDDDIEDFVSDDLEKTIAKANRWKETINAIKANTEKVTTEKLASADLKPSMSNVNQNEEGEMTFDKFSSLSADEQNKWLDSHPDGLSNL